MTDEVLKILIEMKGEISEIKATGIATLNQATRTNGRVTVLEKSNEELSKLVSRHNGELLRIAKMEEERREQIKENGKQRNNLYFFFIEKIVLILTGLFLAKFFGPELTRLIQL